MEKVKFPLIFRDLMKGNVVFISYNLKKVLDNAELIDLEAGEYMGWDALGRPFVLDREIDTYLPIVQDEGVSEQVRPSLIEFMGIVDQGDNLLTLLELAEKMGMVEK